MGNGWKSLRPFFFNCFVLLNTIFPFMFYVIKFSHFILFVIFFYKCSLYFYSQFIVDVVGLVI